MSRPGLRQSDSVTARRKPRPPGAHRLSWALRLGAILQLFVFGTATYAGTPIPSSTPTATPTPVTLGGSASGFNGVTGDCNENAVVSIDELVRGVNIALERQPIGVCRAFDANGDGRVSVAELVAAVGIALRGPPPTFTPIRMPTQTPTQIVSGDLVTLLGSSPAHGESGVAVTRETVLRFSGPVDPSSVTGESIIAVWSGFTMFARRHVSPDQRTVTLFYETLLPATSRVRVTVDGGRLRGVNGMAVDADGDGQPGGDAIIDFDTVNVTTLPGTAVCGRVFASELVPGANGTSMNVPLAGVTIQVDGAAAELNTVTDQFGNFRLEPAPVGRFFVFIRGTTATVGVPPGAYYPDVGKAWEATAGVETTIGDIFLPLIEAGTLQPVSATSDTVIRFPESVRQEFPELADVQLTVPADSLFDDRLGTRGGMVGIAPVAPDRIPSRLPPGLDFPLVITVQTDGGENFDRPVPVCFPNLPDRTTGQPLAPGAESALWSFNHDTGEFEVVGPMRVTADGRLVCTEPGVGIIAPGWHGSAPGASGGGGPLNGPGDDDDQEKDGDSPAPGAPSKKKCKKDSGDGDDVVDPVYLFSGELYEEVTDLRIAGRGLDFVWSRKYRSKIGPNTVQGNGWDFSYNISLIPDGADLIVCDGNSRRDSYGVVIPRSTSGAAAGNSVTLPGRGFTRPESFQELFVNADGTVTMTFPDGGTWLFNPLDGSPIQGKIRSSTDRNGNSLRFAYDAAGRLATITDTLDRDITVAYNTAGFIESVTDFAGRQVRYEYYDDGDADGSFGDLKSVRSPLITGTPNRNDFPSGKRTTYTYTTGFSDDRLNHNLLSITDGRRNDPNDPTFGDGPYVVNTYAATQNPDDVDFDRVVQQQWGGPNDIVSLVYVPQTPSAANANAYTKTIVNDRVGNVKEYFFERGNRVVIRREYTGRAIVGQPTTDTANRPAGKLRPGDPAFFETRYQWNDASLMTRVDFPNGNSVEYLYEPDLNPNASSRQRGNLRRIRRLAGRLAPSSDQDEIVEEIEYDSRFGCGSCTGEFVMRYVDGRGNETLHEYDAQGNRTQTTHRIKSIVDDFAYNSFGQMVSRTHPDNGSGHRRRDAYAYYDSGPQRGYLRQQIIDDGGLALTTTYEYDGVGNVVRMIDPRNHDVRYTVNPLNQIVRATSREVSDGSGLRYTRDYFFDANNNFVRVEIENRDDAGVLRANPTLTKTNAYDLLNHLVRTTDEVDDTRTITTEYAYDANRNLVLRRSGEATSGRQPENVVAYEYDERDRLFRAMVGAGSSDASTVQWDYDGNGNVSVVRRGIEDAPRVTQLTYDGFDRFVTRRDPMGNEATRQYDANHNVVSTRFEGELSDGTGSAANVRLGEARYAYDDKDRLTRRDRLFFALDDQSPLGNGLATTQLTYTGTSQVARVEDDNGHASQLVYDGAHRLRELTDAAGNTVALEYDANSNLIGTVETDQADLGGPPETFAQRRSFDNLDRLVAVVNKAGDTYRYGVDSRGNRVRHVDTKGNVTRRDFDGLDRVIAVTAELTDTGDGTGTVVDTITTSHEWDDASRLVRLIDDSGNATVVEYDALDRIDRLSYADGTTFRVGYDIHGNRLTVTDANGTVIESEYDLLDRVIARTVTRAAGIEGTTSETFGYDGLSQLALAQDNDTILTRAHDSLANILRETLNGETTTGTYDAEHNQLTCTYPGGRQITTTYDELDRAQSISDAGGEIVGYDFIGPGRVQQRACGNGTETTYAYDAARRMVRSTHRAGAGAIIDDREYAWDAAFSQTSRRDLRTGGRRFNYGYDSLERLRESERVPAAGTPETVRYLLDNSGNRLRVDGGALAGLYQRSNQTPEPADAQVHQYTETPFDARAYDRNANLVSIDRAPSDGSADTRLGYDYRNQLVRHVDETSGVTTTYAYDILGRRVAKVVDDGTPQTTRYFYNAQRVVEEQDGTGATEATYVYGHYVDEAVQMRRGNVDRFFHADATYNTMAVSDAAGAVVERYEYDDYGLPTVFDPAGAIRPGSTIGNPYLFTGRRFDPESELYEYRTRYLDPRVGRFITRDTIGIWGDPLALGNGYTYAGNNPFSRLDPGGLTAGAALAVADVATGGAIRAGERALINVGTREALAFAERRGIGAGAEAAIDNFASTVLLPADAAGAAIGGAGIGGTIAAELLVAMPILALELALLDAVLDGVGAAEAPGGDEWDEPTLPDVPVPLGPDGTVPDFPDPNPNDPSPWDDDSPGCGEPDSPADSPADDAADQNGEPEGWGEAEGENEGEGEDGPRPLPEPVPEEPNDPDAPRPLPPSISSWTEGEAPEPIDISRWTNQPPMIHPGGGGGVVEIPDY